MISMHDAARRYGAIGWRVFPCEARGKRPLVKWRDAASTDPAVIDAWWSQRPDANIGLVCGEHFTVIDLDSVSARDEFAAWCVEHGIDWHVYPRVATDHGWHVYVALSDARNSAGLRPHIDVRGVGGYVLAPPSVHPNGSVYRWTQTPNGAMPTFPVAAFLPKPTRATAPAHAATGAASEGRESAYGIKARDEECEAVRTAVEGTRNDTLNTAALKLAQLVAGGELDERATRAALRDAARDSGLEPDEVDKTIASAFAAGSNEPRSAPPSTAGRKLVRRRRSEGAGEADTERRIVSFAASTVERERLQWLWPGYIALGKEGMLVGDADQGKSTITCDLAARVTRGDLMPDESTGLRTPYGVVMLVSEDGYADTVRPRLEAAGADLDRVYFVKATLPDGWEDTLTLPDDIEGLREAITKCDAKLIIVDPVIAFLGDKVDSYSNHQIRRAMRPLHVLAQETGVAVLGISHPSRGRGNGNPLDFSGGSLGFVQSARNAALVHKDPDEDGGFVLASIKCNLGIKPESLSYRIVPWAEDEAVGRIEWGESAPYTAAQLLAGKSADDNPDAVITARNLIRAKMGPGSVVPAKDMLEAAAANNVSKSALRRARVDLKVTTHKDGLTGGWEWHYPEDKL